MINFKKYRIGDLVSIRRGASPRPIEQWISPTGVPWVKISDATLNDSKYIYNTAEFIKKDGKTKSVEVFPEDLIISNSATPALPRIMKINACVHDGWLIPYNYKGITRDYLYYAIKYYRKFLLNQGNGSIFKNLKTDILKDFEINIPVNNVGEPDLDMQKKIIAPILKIDEQIENNLKIIKINNKMLDVIYNYFFNNCLTDSSKIATWKKIKINDVIIQIKTGLNPRDNFKFNENNKIKYITVKNLTEHGYLDMSSYDKIDNKAKKTIHDRSDIQKGDILFASIAPLGRCYMINEEPNDWDINESVFSIRVNNDILPTEYVYFYLKSEQFVKKAENNSTGSIFSGIRINTLLDMEILIPDKNTLSQYMDYIKPILKINNEKGKEIILLKEIRDFMLPLIMNNQIKTEDV